MYYYGGYSQGGNQGCGCNSSYTGGYNYPTYGGYGYGYGGYGNGYGSGAAIVLVLFILLVIIIGTRNFVTV